MKRQELIEVLEQLIHVAKNSGSSGRPTALTQQYIEKALGIVEQLRRGDAFDGEAVDGGNF